MLKFKKILKKNESLVYMPMLLTFNQLSASYVSIGVNIKFYCSLFSDLIYAQRKGILILDLRITIFELKKIAIFIEKIVLNRGKIFYVDNFLSENYDSYLKFFFKLKHYSFNSKWKGGFLSNFKYLYFEVCKNVFFSKFSFILNEDFINKVECLFSMRRIPNLVIIPSIERNFWTASESAILRLPCVVFNNGSIPFNFNLISIPGNTNHIESLKIYSEICLMAIINGYIKEILTFKVVIKKQKEVLYKKYLVKKKKK